MPYQKTSDQAPPIIFLPPPPFSSPTAPRAAPKVSVHEGTKRESLKPPYMPSAPGSPQLEMKAMQERVRSQFEAIQPVAPRGNPPEFHPPEMDGVAAAIGIFFTTYFLLAIVVSIASAIAMGFFGYIGVKLAAKLIGPLPIRDATPRPSTETITMQRIGPPPNSNVFDV